MGHLVHLNTEAVIRAFENFESTTWYALSKSCKQSKVSGVV